MLIYILQFSRSELESCRTKKHVDDSVYCYHGNISMKVLTGIQLWSAVFSPLDTSYFTYHNLNIKG